MVSMSPTARATALRAQFGAAKHIDALGTLYVALYRGDPFGSGTEPTSAGGYARVAYSNNSTNFGTIGATQTSAQNLTAVTWPVATGLYSITDPLTHWAVFDASSGGVLWYGGELVTPITVSGAGDQPRMPVNGFSVSQAGS